MKPQSVNIDFTKMAVAFRKHVLEKALNAGSTIIYMKDGKLIEEDPKIFQTLKNNVAVQ
jgi:ABC-type proline/glycine betaine transport system ATPase subunit